MGYAFSLFSYITTINPSLKNIFTVVKDSGYKERKNGDLTDWVNQGVFLLNVALTVEEGDAGSHISFWYKFTKTLIEYIYN